MNSDFPEASPRGPLARRIDHTLFGPFGERADEYYWMRDDDPDAKRPEIIAQLEAENAHTEAWMAPHAALRARLVAEMRARIQEEDSSSPVYDHGYWYWRHFASGAEYPVYLRRRGTVTAMDAAAGDEVLLDVPELARDAPFLTIGARAVSPDNRLLAFTEDRRGRRISTLRIRNLETGEFLPDSIDGVLESIAWSHDSAHLFYIRQDPQTLQSGPVYRHRVGDAADADRLVYDEPDKTLFTDVDESRSREFILIQIHGFDTTELRVVDARDPHSEPRLLIARRADVRTYADHLAGRWILMTNDSARNFRLVDAGQKPDDRGQWRDLVPARSAEALEDFALFDEAIVIQERVEANSRLRILPWGQGAARLAERIVAADEPAFAMSLDANPDPSVTRVRYAYTSMVAPRSILELDFAGGARTLLRRDPVPTYEPSDYRSERVWIETRDARSLPVTLFFRPDRYRQDGTAPLLLKGYGAYGYSSDPAFSLATVSLADRGFAVALAHVRGGSELGQDWYEEGRLMHKRNTFNDFVDATDALVRLRYAARDKVFAIGGSAGGLLMGVIANEAGDRYRAIAAIVPFVDLITTMQDESLPLTTNEWAQWGDPREAQAYRYMLSYSPYDNLAAKAYPAMFVSTGLWDSQVQYFEPAKYVARLRRLKTDEQPLLFHINMAAGHSGKSGRFQALDDIALQYTFFLGLLGIDS
jgi:oligopeptidase B